MSQEEDDSAEKAHDPTERRLDEARKQGDIPLAPEVTTFAVQAMMTLVVITLGGLTLGAAGQALMGFLVHPDAQIATGAGPFAPVIGPGLFSTLLALAPWFILPPVAAILALLAQKAPAFAPSKLIPKASRLSLLTNAKQKYGPRGLMDFGKAAARLIVVAALLGTYLSANFKLIIAASALEPGVALGLLGDLLGGLMIRVVIAGGAFAFIDLIWQRHSFQTRNRMSRKQLTDELKETEGDPYIRQKRRARATAIATAPLRKVVAEAHVIIVNPTHFAVVLAWDPARDSAPRCTAKGMDDIALRIREFAAEHAVPIHSDPATARALFAGTRIGDEIDASHYRAVAAAIRFADQIRTRAAG